MILFLRRLQDWCDHYELAKNHLHERNNHNQLFAWLRRNSRECYLIAPTRIWSIAMQTVYYGDVDKLQTLLQICPPTDLNIWILRGRDGKSLLDVATEENHREIFPAMFEFVRTRSTRQHENVPQVMLLPVAGPMSVGVEAKGPDVTDQVRLEWPQIRPANVLGPIGECHILYSGPEQLYRPSRDCSRHSYSRLGLEQTVTTALSLGPFPLRCPGCVVEGPDRGIMTRSSIKGLVVANILSETDAKRLLVQQVMAIPDEPSLDYQFSISKPCPGCSTPIAHYKSHGCHHIMPGGGCPSCHTHFCYVCLGGYPCQQCNGFCDNTCDCPICPDCKPGFSCSACDGRCPACTI